MSRILTQRMAEAEELLEEIRSWDEKEIEELPRFYREKAREYRRLMNNGDE